MLEISLVSLFQALCQQLQNVSRWETSVNYPDITILPLLASFFNVTTDFLLGMKGDIAVAKLLKTVETFEFESRDEAENMVREFKSTKFPLLKDFQISETDGVVILEVTKEFNADVNTMKFDK